jgi:hypothetical protein
MPELSAAAQGALVYWPQIEYAAATGMNTADLWSTIRDAAEEAGFDSPGVSVQGVSQLRGMATGIQRAAAEFAEFPDNKRIRATMVGQAPWSRSLAEMKAQPTYQVRFVHTFMDGDVQRAEWRSVVFDGKLPRTAGELRALVEGDAVQLSRKYKVGHVSSDQLQVLAV